MSGLDDRPLLMWDSIDSKKEDADDKTKKLVDTLSSIPDKIVEDVDHMFHQIKTYSPDHDVEDCGLSEITIPTS